ncbi:TetR/AcrR family transcriptional regulator [Spirosoma koreense]
MEKNKRNRAATTQRIVDALEKILNEDGLKGVNINAVAEKAAVSKVLVYRYFGSTEGLLEYYLRMGRLIPRYTTDGIEQIRPTEARELATVWSGHALQLFRQIRSSRAARAILKASVQEQDPLADTVSRLQDEEMTYLVSQLAFVNGADFQAASAVIMGALSYLTIQAQFDRPVIGIDLRSEEGWLRIEEMIKSFYKSFNQTVLESPASQLHLKPASHTTTW